MYQSNEISALERQHSTAQYMLLATVLTTAVNLLLLLTNATVFIPYCAALPYYLTMMGYYFDGYAIATYTVTGLILAAVLLVAWLLVWWQAKKRIAWLKVGMILVIVDTVILAVFAFVFLESPASCLLEGLLHLAVIYELHVGLNAYNRLRQLQQESSVQASIPWEEETPASAEYSDKIS